MDPRDFKKVLRTTVVTPILLLALLAGVLVWQTAYMIGALDRLDRTDRIISESRSTMRLIIDMETGLRGFQLSGDDSLLESYRRSESQIFPALQKLSTEFAGHPAQTHAIQQLTSGFQNWYEYSKAMIEQRRSTGAPSDPQAILLGKQMMDSIRDAREQLVASQEQTRTLQAAEARRASRQVLLSVGILTLLFGFILAILTRRRMLLLSGSYEKHIDLERRRAEEARENRQWLLTTLQSMGEGVVATNTLGQVEFMNPIAEQLTGWTQTEAEGKSLQEIFYTLDEHTHQPTPDVMKVLQEDLQHSGFVNHTLLRSRSGEEAFIDHSAAEILDEHGTQRGTVLVFRDMTQRKRAEDALRSSEKLALIGRLSATIAHEIRNPLDSVTNLLYLLRRSPKLDDEATSFICLAEEEIARVAQIVKQLLSFNREARKAVEVDVAEILESAAALFMPKLDAMQIKMYCDFGDRPKVIGFPGELRQVFSNLISNALEASHRGGLISVRVKRSKNWNYDHRDGVRIMVCDTGTGIPVDARGSLFQPFFTTKGEHGTGLGLWVSRGIVEKHEGSMKFRTSTNSGHSGTCFNVFLPNEPQIPSNVTEVA